MSGPIDMVSGYLDGNGVDYEVIEHPERFTAAAEARAAGVGPDHAAKDVMLRDGDACVLAVIPASERLDFEKARRSSAASSAHALRLKLRSSRTSPNSRSAPCRHSDPFTTAGPSEG